MRAWRDFCSSISRPSKWLKVVMSSFGVDTFKFGLFLGSLIGSYKAVLCLMRWIRGKEDRVRTHVQMHRHSTRAHRYMHINRVFKQR